MKLILNGCFSMRLWAFRIARRKTGRSVQEFPRKTILTRMIVAPLILVLLALAAKAADANETEAPRSSSSSLFGYFTNWFDRVDETKAEQPHWPSPLATTVVPLKEALRYDISQQSLRDGHTLTSFGSGKGLEFIPAERIQLIVGLPAWQTENTSPEKTGFADQTFLIKYRLRSANETNGNYVVTAMLGLAVPNGSSEFTTHHFVFTPTAAFGKGWGRFDFQSNLGVSVPENEAGRSRLGTPVVFNTTMQYHLAGVSWPEVEDHFNPAGLLWPEVEVNYTYWPNGRHEGLNQVFITPGLALYKFPIGGHQGSVWGHREFVLVAGSQFAVTDHALYHRNLIVSFQFVF